MQSYMCSLYPTRLPACLHHYTHLQAEERDGAVQRVLYVDLLNLLALDSDGGGVGGGGSSSNGARVRVMLDASGECLPCLPACPPTCLPATRVMCMCFGALLCGADSAGFGLEAHLHAILLACQCLLIMPATLPLRCRCWRRRVGSIPGAAA